jgi:membrane protein DedA with SNARE-associated domain
MTIEQAIQNYGSLAVFLGTLFEGEIIVILAAFAAHQGYLPLWHVMLAAFAGACLGDQFYFYLGRHYAQALLSRRPGWRKRMVRATALVERYHLWIIPVIRYLYGLRLVLGLAIGMSRVSSAIFALLNAAGVMLWSLLLCLGGYFMGRAMQASLEDAKKYERVAAVVIAGVGLAFWAIRRYRFRHE